MKTPFLRLALAFVLVTSVASCTTAYDAYGRPQTVVTPGGAALGAAAVGLVAYSLANSNNDRYSSRRHYHRSYHGHSRHHRGYRY